MGNGQEGEIKLVVNGQEISLNPFVRGVFESVTVALFGNLHTDIKEVETLELTLTRKRT